jgi:nitrile hydratase subunit beta
MQNEGTSTKLQHYLGGLEGLGPVTFEKRVFVEPWEKRIFGIHVAMMVLSSQLPLPKTPSKFKTIWTWADLRKGAESLNPFDYFKYRYYEKWLGGISSYFVEQGYITQEELDARTQKFLSQGEPAPTNRGDSAIDKRVIAYLIEGDSPKREIKGKPRFKEGKSVFVKNVPTVEHTRLPGFLRNQIGVVDKVHEKGYNYLCSTGPDGIGDPMPVYCVRFDPEKIWKGNTEKNVSIYADLYEAYLDKVTH